MRCSPVTKELGRFFDDGITTKALGAVSAISAIIFSVFLNTFGLLFSFGVGVFGASESEDLTRKVRSNSEPKSSISRSLAVGPDIALSSSFFLGLHLFAGRRDGLSPYVCTAIR
jgi:hypothetical protein